MAMEMRMRAVRRKQIDDEKLALAFLLLAKILNTPEAAPAADGDAERPVASEEAA